MGHGDVASVLCQHRVGGELAKLVGWGCVLASGSLQSWLASAALGVGAAKNLRKHARAALACLTGFCGHAPFYNFFIAHPLPQSLQSLAGAPLKTEDRTPKPKD